MKTFQPADHLHSRTFLGLLVAQFFAAFNDQAIHAAAMFFAINTNTLNDETAIVERPCADGGTLATADGTRQGASVALEAIELGERARHRERQLRPRAEPDMRRQRSMHVHGGTGAQVVMLEEQTRELKRTPGIFTIGHKRVGGCGGDEQGGPCRGGANAAEPSTARAAQIEDAEMQTRRRLDEDGFLVSCVHRYLVDGGSEDPPLRSAAV